MRPPASALRRALPLLCALALSGGCGPGAPDSVVNAADGAPSEPPGVAIPVTKTAIPEKTAEQAEPDPTDDQTPPPGKHPDPCGVDDGWDTIMKPGNVGEAPADRVQTAAKKLYGGRFLGVYIADVERQKGVGVGVHNLTGADQDAFFAATCFRRGDVVFENGPVSNSQLQAWREEVRAIAKRTKGWCSLSPDWRTGRLEIGMEPGSDEFRREVEARIPAENLKFEEGDCPVGQ